MRLMLLSAFIASPTTGSTDTPKWTDVELAHWTIALAIATFLLVAVTIWITATDRRRAEREAGKAEARLNEAREESDRRIREERAAVEQRALRERQIMNAARLLQRIAALDPLLEVVPLLRSAPSARTGSTEVYEACRDAVASVKEGALAEALALHSATGTKLYRALAQLLVDAVEGEWVSVLVHTANGRTEQVALAQRVELDLRRFSRYVRLWLHALIDSGQIPDDVLGPFAETGLPLVPVLGRRPLSPAGWVPQSLPPGWEADTQLDPHDPQYRPANERG